MLSAAPATLVVLSTRTDDPTDAAVDDRAILGLSRIIDPNTFDDYQVRAPEPSPGG